MPRIRYLPLLLFFCLGSLCAGVAEQIGPHGGDVRSLAVHPEKPDRFFLGTTHGGIFISNDAGQSWQRLLPGIPHPHAVVDNLVFHPEDPDTLYAACWDLKSDRGWLFRTRDSGANWETLSLGYYNSAIRAIAIAPSDPSVLAVGITEGVLLSRDAGVSWERVTRGYRSLYNVESLAFDPNDPSTIYVGTWRLGWKTTDGGKKWQAIHQGMHFDSDMFALLVHPLDPTRLFASACTGVYRSDNAGLQWTKLRNGLPSDARRTRTLHLDSHYPEVVYAGSTNGLFISRDGGGSFSRVLEDVIINAVASQPRNQDLILVGVDGGGVLRSADGGVSFQAANQGFSRRQVAALAVNSDDGTIYASSPASGGISGFFVANGHSQQWQRRNDGLDLALSVHKIIPAPLGNRVFLNTSGGLYSGVPGQEPWRLVKNTSRLEVLDLAIGSDADVLFLGTREGVKKLDLKSGQLRAKPIPVYQGRVSGLFYDAPRGWLYAATDMGVFRSEDEGDSWTIRVKGLPPIPVHWITGSGGRLLSGTTSGLFVSEDQAASWHHQPKLDSRGLVEFAASPESDFLAVLDSSGNLFWSRDGGRDWQATPSPGSQVLAFAVERDALLIGTLSNGILRVTPSAAATGGQ